MNTTKTERNNLRLYVWANNWLSSIQKGIQTAHLVHAMFVKYTHPRKFLVGAHEHHAATLVMDWATYGQTIILLNGGSCAGLQSVCDVLRAPAVHPYPFTSFSEDKDSLNQALTVVGVIVPERVYRSAWKTWNFEVDPTPAEHEIGAVIESSQLAV